MVMHCLRFMGLVCLGTAMAGWYTCPAVADVEPNDAKQRAERIEPGTYEGHVGAGGDEWDYYVFAVTGGDIIHLTMARVEGAGDVEMWLLDHEAAGLEDLEPVGDAEETWLTAAELGERFWYLQLSGEGPYRFSLQVTRQDDGGQGVDAPEDYEEGLAVRPGEIRGRLEDDDEWDSYRFTVAENQTIQVEFTADFTRFAEDMGAMELVIRNAEGDRIEDLESAGQVATFREGPLGVAQSVQWSLTVGREGDYLIVLRTIGAEAGQIGPVGPELAIEGPAEPVAVEPVGSEEPLTASEQPTVVDPAETQPAETAAEGTPTASPVQGERSLFVRIALDSLYCRSESDWDRATDSDEPYLIVTGFAIHRDPPAWSTGEPRVLDDVDAEENRRVSGEQRIVFEGEVPEGARLGFSVLAMESDDWTRESRQRLAEHLATQTAAAISGAMEAVTAESPDMETYWDMSADQAEDLLGTIFSLPHQAYMALLEWITGGEDDRIADAGVSLHYDELIQWAADGPIHAMPTVELDGGDEGQGRLRWHLEFDEDASYEFDAKFTHWDEFAVGNIVPGPEAEIVTACDEDASGNNGKFRVYSAAGAYQGSFECFFTNYDHVAIGDVLGAGTEQIVIASDDHGGMINIYTGDGRQVYSFGAPFTHYDGLAVGNVLGDAKAEILLARDDDRTVLIYDDQGEQRGGFDLAWDFDGTRYTDETTRHDVFLVGDVLGDDYAEIVMVENKNGAESELFVYDANGRRQQLPLTQVFLRRYGAVVLADVEGDVRKELVVAADSSSGHGGCWILVYDLVAGRELDPRPWPILTRYDGLAAGDVLGVGKDQVLLATDEDDCIRISK